MADVLLAIETSCDETSAAVLVRDRARAELEERMNIDPEATAVIDGVEANEGTVLREGQVLNFVKPAGEKG